MASNQQEARGVRCSNIRSGTDSSSGHTPTPSRLQLGLSLLQVLLFHTAPTCSKDKIIHLLLHLSGASHNSVKCPGNLHTSIFAAVPPFHYFPCFTTRSKAPGALVLQPPQVIFASRRGGNKSTKLNGASRGMRMIFRQG